MNYFNCSKFFLLAVALLLIPGIIFSQGIIIDHSCTDITQIPDTWINKVKSMLKIHYAHTSHGEQITEGLERLSNANSKYNYYPDNCNIPQTTQYLSLMDGQYFDYYCETYVSPDLYWEGTYGLNITRSVLNSFDANISLWAWCTQLDYYSQSNTQAYLNTMSQLESEYPDVTFIYMTGNAQSEEQNRYDRNSRIRAYCEKNNKILFDFADLDCWYNGQQYIRNGIPMEHPQYHGDEGGHTTYESCENKAKAFWWLLARIAGWDSNGGSSTSPNISLDKTQLNFYCGVSGSPPSSQTFSISNSGIDTLNWTVSTNAGWLDCSPTTGVDSGTVTVSVDRSGLAAGTYTAAIKVSSSNAGNSPQTVNVTLTIYGAGNDSPPFGSFDTPVDGSTVRSSIPVTGWALDDIGIEHVKIYRSAGKNLVYIGDAVFVEGARPDVETANPGFPDNSRAGWGYMMLTNFLPNGGNGTFTLYAQATDITGHQVTLGTKTINCDNASAVKPFGAIDTPTQGGTASGGSFINWGWVLTPLPNRIPTNGSTINVYVNGEKLGHPTYNIYRADIAGLFPGNINSNGAAGYFYLDTTAYKDGVHTIQWTAVDSAGNIDGIGSRYFTVQNTGGSSGAMTRANALNPEVSNVDSYRMPFDETVPIRIKKGFQPDNNPHEIYQESKDNITIEIKELERVEINFGRPVREGFQVIAGNLRPLPIGSSLDTQTGIFCWLPGAGFNGTFELVFITGSPISSRRKNRIFIKIVPGFK